MVGDVLGEERDHLVLRLKLAPGDLAPELPGQRARQRLLLHELQLEQVGSQPAAVEHLPVERFLEPVLREVALADEDLADAHARLLF